MSFSHSLSGAVHATESREVLATRISIPTKGGPVTCLTARVAFVRLPMLSASFTTAEEPTEQNV